MYCDYVVERLPGALGVRWRESFLYRPFYNNLYKIVSTYFTDYI